jgi:hypothetical protein
MARKPENFSPEDWIWVAVYVNREPRELGTVRSNHPDRPFRSVLFAKALNLVAADCGVLR